MTPANLLGELRKRGYCIALDGSDVVVRRRAAPPDEKRTLEALRAAKADLVALLETEAHPLVRNVMNVFPDARLVSVTTADGRQIR